MSSTNPVWEKNDVRLIAVRALRMVVPTVIVTVALLGLYNVLGRTGQTVTLIFAVYYAWTRFNQLFYTYYSVRWRVTPSELVVRRGIFFVSYTNVAFRNIIGITTHQGRYERLLGVKRVVVETKVAQGVIIKFDAVRHSPAVNTLDQVVSARKCELEESTGGESHEVSVSKEKVAVEPDHVATISRKRLLAISFTYGKYLLFIPLGLGIVSRTSNVDFLDIASAAGDWLEDTGPLLISVAVLGFLATSVAYGYAVCLLMYGNLRVSGRAGVLKVERGVFTRWVETIESENVDTLRIRQNVVMRLAGLHDLRATVRGSADETREHVVSPGLTSSELNEVLSGSLRRFDNTNVSNENFSILGYAVKVIPRIIVFAAILLTVSYIWDPNSDILFGLLLASSIIIFNRCFITISYSNCLKVLKISQGFLTKSTWIIPGSSICNLSTTYLKWFSKLKRLTVVFRSGGTLPKRKHAYLIGLDEVSIEGVSS